MGVEHGICSTCGKYFEQCACLGNAGATTWKCPHGTPSGMTCQQCFQRQAPPCPNCARLERELADWKGRAANERASGLMTAQELQEARAENARLREAIEAFLDLKHSHYGNPYRLDQALAAQAPGSEEAQKPAASEQAQLQKIVDVSTKSEPTPPTGGKP